VNYEGELYDGVVCRVNYRITMRVMSIDHEGP
jgi:hypothetical protein